MIADHRDLRSRAAGQTVGEKSHQLSPTMASTTAEFGDEARQETKTIQPMEVMQYVVFLVETLVEQLEIRWLVQFGHIDLYCTQFSLYLAQLLGQLLLLLLGIVAIILTIVDDLLCPARILGVDARYLDHPYFGRFGSAGYAFAHLLGLLSIYILLGLRFFVFNAIVVAFLLITLFHNKLPNLPGVNFCDEPGVDCSHHGQLVYEPEILILALLRACFLEMRNNKGDDGSGRMLGH